MRMDTSTGIIIKGTFTITMVRSNHHVNHHCNIVKRNVKKLIIDIPTMYILKLKRDDKKRGIMYIMERQYSIDIVCSECDLTYS